MEKYCKGCDTTKSVTEFYRKRKTSYQTYCKVCSSKRTKDHYIKNKRVNKKLLLKGIMNNLGLIKCSKCKVFKPIINFNKDSSKSRGFSSFCKHCYKEYYKGYLQINRTNVSEYYKKKYKENPLFNLRMRLKNRLNNCLTRGKGSRTEDIIGCSYEHLIKHLNTNEFGFKYGDEGLDIDHIVPVSTATSNLEVQDLFNYKNLQLLPSVYNRHIKVDNTFDKQDLIEWLKKN